MENPYQSPQENSGSPFGSDGDPNPTWARQVPIVAILLMVQGGLEAAVSAGLLLLAGAIPWAVANAPQAAPGDQMPLPMMWTLSGLYLGLGLVVLLAGLLKLVAGWRNFGYRNRLLGILALFSSLLSALTCYCAPTGLLLCVYGSIVYFNGRAAECFARAAAGASAEEIRRSLA